MKTTELANAINKAQYNPSITEQEITMKNNIVTFASPEELVINGDNMLGLSVAKFAKLMTSIVDELSSVHGLTANRVVGSLSAAMRRALNKRVRKAEGLVSVTMAGAIMDKNQDILNSLSTRVNAVADWAEALFAEYKDHADILTALSDYDVAFHPFQRRQAVSFEVNNEVDAEEFEDYGYDDSEDYMDDEAAAWLQETMLQGVMAQSDLRHQKVNSTAAQDSEIRFEVINITREEWIEERLYREPTEWKESAAFGAWDAIQHVLDSLKRHAHFNLVTEMIGELPEKKVAASTKIMRKAIDFELKVERLESRKEYLEGQIAKTDNSESELTIAAMSNAKREGDLDELLVELRDTKNVFECLSIHAEELHKWFKLVQLDTPHRVYSSFMAFDPVEFLVTQMIKKSGYLGERITPRAMAKFNKEALKLLGNPTSIESFVIEDGEAAGLELWGVHFTNTDHDTVLEAARLINKVRGIKHRHDELAAREIKLQKIVKGAAMKNKKPTKSFDLEALTEKFLF